MRYWPFLILFYSHLSSAQTKDDSWKEEPRQEDQVILGRSIDEENLRPTLSYGMHLNYSYLDMMVPGKFGGALDLIQKGNIYELEYLSASKSPMMISQLGNFGDQRISVLYRSFGARKSFHWFSGISYMSTNLEFGNELIGKVTGNFPYYDAFKIEAVGLQFGIGNEWIFSYGKFAVPCRIDWFSVTQPVSILKREAPILDYVNDSGIREALDNAIRFVSWVPHFMLLKVSVGLAF